MSVADATVQALLQVSVSVAKDGQISCSPDPLVVTGSNVTLNFVLATTGWIFPATDAVVVSNGGAQFPQPSRTVTNRLATLLDTNSVKGSFSYTVAVQNASTGVICLHDPTIRNEP